MDRIREQLSAIAESTVVVGNDALAKVHVHTHDPGPVISYAVSQGTISQVSMDNIDQQHREFAALHRTRSADAAPAEKPSIGQPGGSESLPADQRAALAVVAVACGEGLARLFKDLGCAAVVMGGQTMNPSTQELLDAARDTGAGQVILLPNNPNIISVARQVATLAENCSARPSAGAREATPGMKVYVVSSSTIPQGVAALLAFNPEGDLENMENMQRALATVTTVEVTRAVRPVTLGDLSVQEGQYIGLLEGDLVAAADSPLSVLLRSLYAAMTNEDCQDGPSRHEVLTLYWGAELEEDQAKEAAAQLRKEMPDVEVELVYGGQPYYQYIASLE